MTRSTPPARTILTPADPDLRIRLYRAIAQALAVAAVPSVVMIEGSVGFGCPTVSAIPGDLLDPTLGAPAFRSVVGSPRATAVRPVHAPPWPPVGWHLEIGGPTSSGTDPTVPWDLPAPASLIGTAGRLSFQTFWIGGRSDGRIWVSRRVRYDAASDAELRRCAPAIAQTVAVDWSRATGFACRAIPLRRVGPDWEDGSCRTVPRNAWAVMPPSVAERCAEPELTDLGTPRPEPDGHTVALGASGAGKTSFLADGAARSIRQGDAVIVVDLHGDLAPAIAARLDRPHRDGLVAIDVGRRPVVGVAALAGQGEREAAQFIAAVKRLSPDGNDVYWGFRLERIFDSFVRLVQEAGGTVSELYALLTDADRRDQARLTTASTELARFLDELAPIVRRNPDFLWAAASRLAKIVLIPELAELLAPSDGGIPVEDLLEAGRSVAVRIPFTTVGPEAASFAGTLVLARCYLGLAARRSRSTLGRPTVVVLDEVQAFSPRLVAEMLTEGRKFGFRLLVASQYPDRLAPELRAAAAGVNRGVVAFRIPRASAGEVGNWLGLAPLESQRVLTRLPVGVGVARARGSDLLGTVLATANAPDGGDGPWNRAVDRTAAEFPPVASHDGPSVEGATERLLLATLAADERGEPLSPDRVVEVAATLPGVPLDRAVLDDRATALEREGLVQREAGRWRVTPAGERRLGLHTRTEATTESSEHRALLLRAFRLFARRGYCLEIVRQGRYDTTLPDALLRQLPDRSRLAPPPVLARTLRSVEPGWAWRFFGGRDVHVEAEVSGALRPARIRHGLAKARARGAFALFIVGDTGRAAKVRRTLRAEGCPVTEAQVWTLGGAPGSAERGLPRR